VKAKSIVPRATPTATATAITIIVSLAVSLGVGHTAFLSSATVSVTNLKREGFLGASVLVSLGMERAYLTSRWGVWARQWGQNFLSSSL